MRLKRVFLGSIGAVTVAGSVGALAQSANFYFNAEEYNREMLRANGAPLSRAQFAPVHVHWAGPLEISASSFKYGNVVNGTMALRNPTSKAYCFYAKAKITISGARSGQMRKAEGVAYQPKVVLPRGSVVLYRGQETGVEGGGGMNFGYALAAWPANMNEPEGTGRRCGPTRPANYYDWEARPIETSGDLIIP